MNLTTEYSPWFILLCLLAGLLWAGLLYYRNRRTGFSAGIRWLLAGLRFAVVSVLAFLLLAPLVERLVRHVEQPLVVFVQDNSSSLRLHNDSSSLFNDYRHQRQDFLNRMERDFQVRSHIFGESFRNADTVSFTDRFTDISTVFDGIAALYTNRNIGAVILASDGLYNRGLNPVYRAEQMPFPVYTLAQGDTTVRRDLLINNISNNRIAYLGNVFPAEIVVEARQAQGAVSRLTIRHDNEILYSENISFHQSHQLETIQVELEALQPGMQRYQVSLTALDAEMNLQNNTQDFFIEVIDSRQRILLLAHAPHPDVGAIKQTLDDNRHYETEVFLFDEFTGNAASYNLVILHQLPSADHDIAALAEALGREEIPMLFILGAQTNLQAFNSLQQGLQVQPRSDELVEALAEENNAFKAFSPGASFLNGLRELPPLFVPFASYQVAAGARVLFYQRIAEVVTDQPLVLLSDAGSRKTGVISGEGIWRWRLHSFMNQGNHQSFNGLVSSMVQYLSVKEDKSRFQVQGPQLIYENEAVIFEAELYNAAYELNNDPEVQVRVFNQDSLVFPYTMSRTSNRYRLDAGTFDPGTYSWESTARLGNERFTARGSFTVSALDIEGLQTVADHAVLYQIATATGAQMFYPGQWEALADTLTNNKQIAPVLYATKDFDELINLKIIFFLLLSLLTFEWFVRKYSGSY